MIAFDLEEPDFVVVLARPPSPEELAYASSHERVLVNVVRGPSMDKAEAATPAGLRLWTDGWLRAAGLDWSPFLIIIWVNVPPERILTKSDMLLAEARDFIVQHRHAKKGGLWSLDPKSRGATV